MKKSYTLIALFPLAIALEAIATVIENPYIHSGDALDVNGYGVLDYKKYDSSLVLQSSGSVRGTLISEENFYGEEIKIMKLNTTETPVGETPQANEMYEVYIDDDFAFNNTVSSLKYSFSILNRSVGKPPSTRTVTVGDSWENIGYRTGFTENDIQGNLLTLPIRIVIDSKTTFLGLENIETIWGQKTASVVETQKVIESGNQEWSDGSYRYLNTFDITYQRVKEYFLKDMGIYKIETVTEPSGYTFSQTYIPTGYTQNIPFPSPKTTEVLTYEYSTRNLSPKDFSQVIESTNESNSIIINSWTWNGGFPWIYNYETDSWFYYHFNGNSYLTYDVRNGGWYAFNSNTNTWDSR